MSNEKATNIKIEITGKDTNKVKKPKALPDHVMDLIPKPGESIYIVRPYPVIDPADIGTIDSKSGVKITEDDVKIFPMFAYSYTPVMVKASVLTDDLEQCIVNGDHTIDLTGDLGRKEKKVLVIYDEDEAMKKFKALMAVSVKECERRAKLLERTQNYLTEALEEIHH